MTGHSDLDALEARLVAKLRSKLNIKSKSLQKGMRRAGRLLPKEAHRAAETISQAQSFQAHPKLSRRVDLQAVSGAEKAIEYHLNKIDAKERRKDAWLSFAGTQAVNLLGILALVLGLLIWRGLL